MLYSSLLALKEYLNSDLNSRTCYIKEYRPHMHIKTLSTTVFQTNYSVITEYIPTYSEGGGLVYVDVTGRPDYHLRCRD